MFYFVLISVAKLENQNVKHKKMLHIRTSFHFAKKTEIQSYRKIKVHSGLIRVTKC